MAEKAAKDINCSGGSASAVKLDVTDSEAVKAVVQETFDTCGRLDYMFNNAGIAINGRFQDFELTDWHRCIDINLLGVVHGVRSAYSIMEKQGFGHIEKDRRQEACGLERLWQDYCFGLIDMIESRTILLGLFLPRDQA